MQTGCQGCRRDSGFPLAFSMAFQPIVDTRAGTIFGHEALVRGTAGEGAGSILSKVDADNRYWFDQQCRVKAIELASRLFPAGGDTKLSINFLPNAVYEPRACIRQTLETAGRVGFPPENIIFEFTENEPLDTAHLLRILTTYREIGFKTAIDDFGAGFAGLSLLAQYQPDRIKIDHELIRNIHQDGPRQSIVQAIIKCCTSLEIAVSAVGVERAEEWMWLESAGISQFQGNLFASARLGGLPAVAWPEKK